MTHVRKKLIEVALPLDAINNASAREKSTRRGHPSMLHCVYYLRRPFGSPADLLMSARQLPGE